MELHTGTQSRENRELQPRDWVQPQFVLMMALSVGLLTILVIYSVPPLLLMQLPLGIFLFLAFAVTVGVAFFVMRMFQVLWRLRQKG